MENNKNKEYNKLQDAYNFEGLLKYMIETYHNKEKTIRSFQYVYYVESKKKWFDISVYCFDPNKCNEIINVYREVVVNKKLDISLAYVNGFYFDKNNNKEVFFEIEWNSV